MKSRLSSNMGHAELKPRLLGHIVEKPCVHSRGHICDPKFIILCLNVNPHNINVKFGIGPCWVKN